MSQWNIFSNQLLFSLFNFRREDQNEERKKNRTNQEVHRLGVGHLIAILDSYSFILIYSDYRFISYDPLVHLDSTFF